MTEIKHTPGPWVRVDTADYAEIHQIGSRKSPIAIVANPADADAIAALPDLLEALKKADLWTNEEDDVGEWRPFARAAIAKTEGRS